MSEKQPDEPVITLPHDVRIRQRLGMVSRNKITSEGLFPKFIKHARESFTPSELVDTLEYDIREFSDESALGMSALVLNRMPEYLKALVQDEALRSHALAHWNKRLEHLKNGDGA